MAAQKRIGLIGWPTDYSISPQMYNAAFQALGLDDWSYELLPTPPNELQNRMQTLRERGFIGAKVTYPHRQSIIPYLDGVVLSAHGINSVNTLIWEEGRWEGHNTDVYGIRADLEAQGLRLNKTRALVLGAGGTAHAAVLALANAGAHITVVNRHNQRAWDLYRNIKRGVRTPHFRVTVQEHSALSQAAQNVDLILSCTSAGAWPVNTDTSAWPQDVPFPSDVLAYDVVFCPETTRFMQQARDAGATVVGGLGMLVHQGAAAFHLWTGRDASLEMMTQAARDALEEVTASGGA